MEITKPTSHSPQFPGPGTGKWQTTLLALRLILHPELHTPATTNELGCAYNKLAELGCARTLREDHYPTGLCEDVVLFGLPISNLNVFHMCVCVQHGCSLKTVPYVVGYKHRFMSVGVGGKVSADPSQQPALISKVCDQL